MWQQDIIKQQLGSTIDAESSPSTPPPKQPLAQIPQFSPNIADTTNRTNSLSASDSDPYMTTPQPRQVLQGLNSSKSAGTVSANSQSPPERINLVTSGLEMTMSPVLSPLPIPDASSSATKGTDVKLLSSLFKPCHCLVALEPLPAAEIPEPMLAPGFPGSQHQRNIRIPPMKLEHSHTVRSNTDASASMQPPSPTTKRRNGSLGPLQ